MERLVRIAAVLHARGEAGMSGEQLVEVAGFTGEDAADQLAREIRHLRRQGWQIDNVAGPGQGAHFRMATVDNRLTLQLTQPQQRALQQAVLLADRGDLVRRLGLPDTSKPDDVGPLLEVAERDEALDVVVRATSLRSLLRFDYKGSARVVHPVSVSAQYGRWYLRGREDDDSTAGLVKAFVVSRMSDVHADAPGTADTPAPVRHPGLHPMSWEIDPPVDVALRTTADYAPDVRRWLGEPAAVDEEGEHVVLRYRVTHRAAFRTRLYDLGTRVTLLGPDEVRREVVAELRELAGHGGGA